MHFPVQIYQRPAAIAGTFLADLRASPAMGMIMPRAFRHTDFASLYAHGQLRPDQVAVRASAPHRYTARRRTNVRTIEASANALIQIHRLGQTCIRAGIADRRTIHRMLHREAQRRVVIASDLRMFRNHGFDGHFTLLGSSGPSGRRLHPFPALP